ncbi:hypothetical protein NQ317_004337 [Molorchus minor]|uniref:Cyclin B n=1 Tax=Molorchus minor TaxID=1323400 RepID=A0ABQ9ISG9_9CUCU|nr:hypothetical protein NQ317_004337 [Molorchus minor]
MSPLASSTAQSPGHRFYKMALRQRTDILNQENINSRLNSKSTFIKPTKGVLIKRPALGEATLKKAEDNALKKPSDVTIVQEKSVNDVKKDTLKKHDNKPKNICNESEDIKSYSSRQLSIIDPDKQSRNEPQMVTEYLTDIFSYLRELESKYSIKNTIWKAIGSTSKMRAILVSWLVEVHSNFQLYLETLHLCIAIIDRYLQDNKNVGRDTLQLVGTSALLVASKYEEMYLPDVKDFVYICDNTCSQSQVDPLSVHFLRRYNKIAQVRDDHHTLGKYLLELCLVDYEMCHIKPSVQAAAACCLAIGVLNEVMDLSKIWTSTLVHYTSYEYSDFKHVIVDLARLIVKSEAPNYQTIRKKYASSKYAKISLNSKLHGPLSEN